MFEKILLFFVFFLPFQFALRPAEGVDLALGRILAGIIFLWWGARCFRQRKMTLPPPRILFFFTFFLFWITASVLWADNNFWAFRKGIFLYSFLPLFLVFYASLDYGRLRQQVCQALVFGATSIAVVALAQFCSQWIFGFERVYLLWIDVVLPFFLGPAFGGAVANFPSLLVNVAGVTLLRASGFFPDPHMAAFYFGMTLPIALALAWDSVGVRRVGWCFSLCILFIADLLTFSRGGYVGIIVGMSIFLFVLFFHTTAYNKQRGKIIMGAVILLLLLAASPIGARLFSSFSFSDGSNAGRLGLWEEATEVIMKHPVQGVGLGNFALVMKPSATYREPIYAHNVYLDIALETGLVGLFLFVAACVYGILSAWKKWRQEKDHLSLAFLSSLFVFMAHGFFETPIYSVHVLPLLILLLAGSMVLPDPDRGHTLES